MTPTLLLLLLLRAYHEIELRSHSQLLIEANEFRKHSSRVSQTRVKQGST